MPVFDEIRLSQMTFMLNSVMPNEPDPSEQPLEWFLKTSPGKITSCILECILNKKIERILMEN